MAQFYFERKAYTKSLEFCEQLLAVNPALEDVHQQVMLIRKQLGQPTAIVDHFNAYKNTLEEEYGFPPSAETVALYKQLMANP